MTPHLWRVLAVISMAAAVVGWVGHNAHQTSSQGDGLPDPPPGPQEVLRMVAMRQAGLHGDRSRNPDMIAALQDYGHLFYRPTALHALAQLGATEALPIINGIIAHGFEIDRTLAQAARARLLAESESSSQPGAAATLTAKILRFYREIGLTPQDINAGVSRYRGSLAHNTHNPDLPPSLEILAMREIADIVYHNDYQAVRALPEVSSLDFSQDYASALKVQLATLPTNERVAWLIKDLANLKTFHKDRFFEIQLAGDEGPAAARAAASQLRTMAANRDHYAGVGFGMLFHVIEYNRAKDQIPLLEHFTHDHEWKVADGAWLAWSRMANDVTSIEAPGY